MEASRRSEVYGLPVPVRSRSGLATGDLLLAAALAGFGLLELFVRSLNADFRGPRAVNAVLVLLIAAPVAWRRRAPLAALIAYWVPAQIWLDLVYGPHSSLPVEPFLVLLILVYTAASYADGPSRLAVGAVLAGLYASELALLFAGKKGLGNVVPGLVFISFAYVLGRGVHRRRGREASLERRTVMLEEQREAHARRAVSDERDRIARELHDVIAHSVSLIIVQAGAAQRLVERDTPGAQRALETIRAAGGDALDELRRLLDLTRSSGDVHANAEPQPGVARLETLIAQTRQAGLPVEYVVVGAQRPLPPGIDLAVYRIVQEALTNIRKHAGPTTARVHLNFSTTGVELTVADDGHGSARVSNGTGHGLIGMRERVGLYGGTFASGPRSSGGFEIRAQIPLHGAPA